MMLSIARKMVGRTRRLARAGVRKGLLRVAFPVADRLYVAVVSPSLAPLHQEIRQHLAAQAGSWRNSYAEGYPYQGFGRVGILGARPVEKRWASYGVDEYLSAEKDVLDIGSNTGFLSLHVAPLCRSVDGIELNPHMVAIAEATRKHLAVSNVHFLCTGFESFAPQKQYDLVFSFANHHTIDGNLHLGFGRHMERIFELLKPGGLLFFESHNVNGPGLGGPGDDGDLDAKFDLAEQYFEVLKYKMVPVGRRGLGDIDRLFVVMKRRPSHQPDAKRTLSRAEAITRWDYA